jgi:hypothetical protein
VLLKFPLPLLTVTYVLVAPEGYEKLTGFGLATRPPEVFVPEMLTTSVIGD